MAGNELMSLLEYIEQERGVSRADLIEALEKALVSAIRRTVDYGKSIEVNVNGRTGSIKAWVMMDVIEGPTLGEGMNIDEAKQINPNIELGGEIAKEIPQSQFGRIAAQTAKQTMLQQLRKAEKARVFDDFKDYIGDVVSGTVRRYEGNDIILDFQTAEGVISGKERIPSDKLMVGDRVNALLIDINTVNSGPSLILSRSNKKFIRKLFEREVAEISEGIVEIVSVARVFAPAARTKISVVSHDSKVDPIGACIGMRGSRIRTITSELSGEKIDIVRYSEDIEEYVRSAMQPAEVSNIEINEDMSQVNVIVNKDQIRLAIGRNWQNVKLCSQLVGMRVKILTSEEDKTFEERLKDVASSLQSELGISLEGANLLVNNGVLSVDGLQEVASEDFAEFDLSDSDRELIAGKYDLA